MKTFWLIVALCVAAALGGWFTRGTLDQKQFDNKLLTADTIQVKLNLANTQLNVLHDSVVKLEAVQTASIVINQIQVATIEKQRQVFADSLKAIPALPQKAHDLIDSLNASHEQEKTIWEHEAELLNGQLASERLLRTQTEKQLVDTQAENARLRIVLASKPNAVSLTPSGFWRDAAIGLAITTATATYIAIHK